MPVGTERVNIEGYLEIKTADPSQWKLKQRHVWQLNNGPIPNGYNIRFKDGDKLNCDIDNLLMVSDCENIILNHLDFNNSPSETKETLHLMAKVKAKTINLKRENQ